MTEYEVVVENRVFTIKFTTDKEDVASRVKSVCEKEVERDINIPEPEPCPFCGSQHISRAVTWQYAGPIGVVTSPRKKEWEGIIGCSECGVYLREYFDIDDFSKASAEAALVEKWNKRRSHDREG